jgi:hypothetical protein
MWINRILWAIYLALLGVLLPHTAWAFQQFEPEGMEIVGWVAAFTFEAAIAAFTWKLKQRIERTPRYTAGKVWLRKAAYRYLNAYGIALFAALWLSSAANWSHAVEFGGTFKVFAKYSIPPGVFSVLGTGRSEGERSGSEPGVRESEGDHKGTSETASGGRRRPNIGRRKIRSYRRFSGQVVRYREAPANSGRKGAMARIASWNYCYYSRSITVLCFRGAFRRSILARPHQRGDDERNNKCKS